MTKVILLRLSLISVMGLAIAFNFVFVTSKTARADELAVSNENIRSADPRSITFTARVNAPEGLAEVKLLYRVLNPKQGDVGGIGRSSFGPGPENDVSFTLNTRSAERYIPVGSQFRYHWEIIDKNGSVLRTEERAYLFLDGRYPWVAKQNESVTVYYYGTKKDRADEVLAATQSALVTTEDLLEVDVPFPVRVFVWASEKDGELAKRPRGAVFDELVRTGGQRVAPDLLFVFTATSDIVRHEAAHIVTAVAGDGPFSQPPSWLDEGTAVYMQHKRLAYRTAIEFGVTVDRTLRLRNMESPSNSPGEINLFYGQSWSTVDFLIEEFGEKKFAEVFRVIRAGSRTDDALNKVYGFNQDGLYNLWRKYNGLREVEFAPQANTQLRPVAEATRAPLAIPTGIAANTGKDKNRTSKETTSPNITTTPATQSVTTEESATTNPATSLIVGFVALVMASVLGAGALYFARRSR